MNSSINFIPGLALTGSMFPTTGISYQPVAMGLLQGLISTGLLKQWNKNSFRMIQFVFSSALKVALGISCRNIPRKLRSSNLTQFMSGKGI